MSNILETIINKNREVLNTSEDYRRELSELAAKRERHYSFAQALSRPEINIIAELKKASPSKGLIRESFPVTELAMELETGGAAALSVLTEPFYFQGSLENLKLAAGAVKIPILRKDFIFDEIQILEAAAFGADAILLIAAALEPERMAALYNYARSLELDVLCEVHNADELKTVLAFDAEVIGINCRDLKTFSIDRQLTLELLGSIPERKVKVAESGIQNHGELARLRHAGANAFLIGETLMRAPNPGNVLRELRYAY